MWGYIDASFLALIRVSPVSGSERGGDASSVQAIVIGVGDLPWQRPLEFLIDLMPAEPQRIGHRSNWQAHAPPQTQSAPVPSSGDETYWRALAQVIQKVTLPDGTHAHKGASSNSPLPPAQELRAILALYASIPLSLLQTKLPRFITSNGPTRVRSSIRINDDAIDTTISPEIRLYCELLKNGCNAIGGALPELDEASLLKHALVESLFNPVDGHLHHPQRFVSATMVISSFDNRLRGKFLDLVPGQVGGIEEGRRARWLRDLEQTLRATPTRGFPPLWIHRLLMRQENIVLFSRREQVSHIVMALRAMPSEVSDSLRDWPTGPLFAASDSIVELLTAPGPTHDLPLNDVQLQVIGHVTKSIVNAIGEVDFSLENDPLDQCRKVAERLVRSSRVRGDKEDVLGRQIISRLCESERSFAWLLWAGLRRDPTALHFPEILEVNDPQHKALRLRQFCTSLKFLMAGNLKTPNQQQSYAWLASNLRSPETLVRLTELSCPSRG